MNGKSLTDEKWVKEEKDDMSEVPCIIFEFDTSVIEFHPIPHIEEVIDKLIDEVSKLPENK